MVKDIFSYQKPCIIEINKPEDKLYYKFDYDTRAFNVNMDFQHFHDFYEMFILLDESAQHLIEGEIYEIQMFDIVLLKPSILHKTHYPKGEPKNRLIINFAFDEKFSGLEEEFKEVLSIFNKKIPIYRFEKNERQVILNIVNRIFHLNTLDDPLKNFMIHNKFIELLYYIYTFKNKNIYKIESNLDSITNKIYSITSFIHNNYSKELSLDYIADKFFISSYYLSHQFKKVTGFNLINYIQMTRIKNAQQLLLNTDLKITVIAEQCGFTSFSQFNRVFRKFCQISPSRFRAENSQLGLRGK